MGVALRGLSLSGEVCNRTEGRQSGYTLSQDHRVSVPWFKLSSQVKGQNKEWKCLKLFFHRFLINGTTKVFLSQIHPQVENLLERRAF